MKVLKSETIFKGNIIELKVDEVENKYGNKGRREVAMHPGGAAVVALSKGKIILVEQYRYPLDKTLLELPAGKLEDYEDPAQCAIRELEEESGFRTDKVTMLGEIVSTPGFCNEILHLYFTDQLETGVQSHDDGERGMKVHFVTLDEAEEMIRKNEISDAKTICGIYLAKPYILNHTKKE